jgi:hypothetical protein
MEQRDDHIFRHTSKRIVTNTINITNTLMMIKGRPYSSKANDMVEVFVVKVDLPVRVERTMMMTSSLDPDPLDHVTTQGHDTL